VAVIEVDQSIRIGDTRAPTVLALANDAERALLIPASAKRACLRALRGRWKSITVLDYRLFAAALFLLLREHLAKGSRIVVDVEYPGHGRDIKSDLGIFCRRAGFDLGPEYFAPIGKHAPVHRVAIETLRGTRAPDLIVTAEELLNVVQ
jgi:hypothetical protein